MMALQLLLLLQLLTIFIESSLGYNPVYGTKRYGRSSPHRINSPNWVPYQTMLHAQRNPLNYYLYPYSQSYPDDYYYYYYHPQESYPLYYPPARTSKYEVYQAVLPYYYGDNPISKPNYYNGYDTDPVMDLQEQMLQEAEREEREEAQPIGHEMLYENDDNTDNIRNSEDSALDDVNTAFLQNLIMSQVYKDQYNNNNNNQKNYYDPASYSDYYNYGGDSGNYGKWEDTVPDNPKYNPYQEDEDVRELKELAKPHQKIPDDIHWFQRNNFRNQKIHNEKKSGNSETYGLNDRKSLQKTTNNLISTTIRPPITEQTAKRRGQKEEVLMRPATPVKHPFTGPVLEMMSKNSHDTEKKRTPSVYDTIKHMLDMEKSLENKFGANEIRPRMKKRIITSEENLTHQLSVLKKSPQYGVVQGTDDVTVIKKEECMKLFKD